MAFPIRVNDVMSSPVQTVHPDATAAEAAAKCHEEGIGSVVIVENGDLVGIVTNEDFVRFLGEATTPKGRPLREFMSTEVVTVTADTPIGDAVERMFKNDIARLVVFDDDELVGLVSTDDVVRYVPQIFQRYEFDYSPPEAFEYRVRHDTAYELSEWEVESVGLSDECVSVGDRVEFTKTITEEDVRAFATASGDTNRLHLDEEYACDTRFGRRIVHGTLVSGLISAALARFPGVTIYVSENLSFLSPVDIGDRVTAVCEVIEDYGRNKYQLTTDVIGTEGDRVIEGQAAVLIDDPPEAAAVQFESIPSQSDS
ncbi:putative signal transduction protein with CBS domains (plasmid) [Halopiger xanaduensis SH-6]|uniref:Putative signal transduction protein with CBS domains n=2 Tax=Halopiger xanaduensis TaxID=387343 RepID=F8DEA7_HALXS|nr:putative signal transduction protein with CBS domains [Halopiger xanaduensis SH-6]